MMKYSTLCLMVVSLLLGFSRPVLALDDLDFPKSKFLSRVTADVSRSKVTRVQGGDFDDRTERLSFLVKIVNSDPSLAFNDLKFDLFIFGQNQVDRKAFKILQRVSEKFSLSALQEYKYDTPQIVTMWDNTGAVFGEKYKAWYLIIYDPFGNVIMEKSTSAFFNNTKKLSQLHEGDYIDKDLKPVNVPKNF